MCFVETHILPGQEDFYADADVAGSGAGRIFEVSHRTRNTARWRLPVAQNPWRSTPSTERALGLARWAPPVQNASRSKSGARLPPEGSSTSLERGRRWSVGPLSREAFLRRWAVKGIGSGRRSRPNRCGHDYYAPPHTGLLATLFYDTVSPVTKTGEWMAGRVGGKPLGQRAESAPCAIRPPHPKDSGSSDQSRPLPWPSTLPSNYSTLRYVHEEHKYTKYTYSVRCPRVCRAPSECGLLSCVCSTEEVSKREYVSSSGEILTLGEGNEHS